MSKSVTKVVYKPDTQSTDEFMIIVKPVEYKKWKSGETTIPLAEIVDSFEIFHSSQGSQGYLGRPSKQQLENTFGTSKDVDVVLAMLEKGKEQSSGGFHSGTFSMNTARGSASLDNRGKGLSGI
ncbi:DUF1960-domain-containing protein [Boletus edulis BED1]|uniref:DUF1960-domain-containing protein n=1 Tax=Boletus edulis BED1 TaxID=1328754 RepID=A0AAD4B9J7_BOLED|nr:DUF1960-domain-containing protein [Boletus edulis BED1]